VSADAENAQQIFVGIAPQAQVDAYLRGVAHDEVTDFEVDPFAVSTARQPGSAMPEAAAQEVIWTESAGGSGRQTVT
jgi:hypothetical protein